MKTLEKEIPWMDIKEFREEGFLQEANRLFFHPLGLALVVGIDENDRHFLSGVWDYRDDPEGVVFAPHSLSQEKIDNIEKLRLNKSEVRIGKIGSVIQKV